MVCALLVLLRLLLLSLHTLHAFHHPPTFSTVRRSTRCVQGLTAEEILERARKASGIPDEEPPPKLFEDEILSDMQSVLLKLECRVKDGPGALSLLEVEEFVAEMSRIVTEMHQNPHKRPPRPDYKELNSPSTPLEVLSNSVAMVPTADSSPSRSGSTDNEDGPAYDGTGGMGLSRGTVNTYVIDGMDGMSPEEYQKALQDSIIERQRKRKDSGVTGNRATWDYLSSLGGSTGVLKEEEPEDGDDNEKATKKKKHFKPF